MNRLTKLFQQKSNRAFDQYLLAKKKSLSTPGLPGGVAPYPSIQDVQIAVLKCESDIWARAAEFLRNEEINQK